MVALRSLSPLLARAAASAVLVAALGSSLGACYHPPAGLANCYEGLPLAEAVLNASRGSYEFRGVKMVRPVEMERLVKSRFPHNPQGTTPVTATPGSRDCAFAFTGHFTAGQVAGASASASGKAAVVLITTSRQLLFSLVLAKLPEPFSRVFTTP
jgi:hypothetical protein